MIQKEKTETTKLVAIVVTGQAFLHMWGGSDGEIEMKPAYLKPDKATKDNILRTVNDNGFGVESIYEACLCLEALYDNGTTDMLKDDWWISHPLHTRLFNGWRSLQEQDAYYKR